MAVMRFTETSVITYQSTRRHTPEDLYLHQRLCEDIRSFSTNCLHIPLLPCAYRTAPLYVRLLIFNLHHTRLIYPALMSVRNSHIAWYTAVTIWGKTSENKGPQQSCSKHKTSFACLTTSSAFGIRAFKSVISFRTDSFLILIIVQKDATQSSLFIILHVHSTCSGW